MSRSVPNEPDATHRIRLAAGEHGVSDLALFLIVEAMMLATDDGQRPGASPAELVRMVGTVAATHFPEDPRGLLARAGIHASEDVGRIVGVLIEIEALSAGEGEDPESYRGLPLFAAARVTPPPSAPERPARRGR
jgi:hypothetical protein